MIACSGVYILLVLTLVISSPNYLCPTYSTLYSPMLAWGLNKLSYSLFQPYNKVMTKWYLSCPSGCKYKHKIFIIKFFFEIFSENFLWL